MALRRNTDMLSAFSMASMTDVIFLLLIFFMVTSTFVFPTALEINLPQGTEKTSVKPAVRLYVDSELQVYVSRQGEQPVPMADDMLVTYLREADTDDGYIAVYADETVPYGRLVTILDAGQSAGLKMILATRPAPISARP